MPQAIALWEIMDIRRHHYNDNGAANIEQSKNQLIYL